VAGASDWPGVAGLVRTISEVNDANASFWDAKKGHKIVRISTQHGLGWCSTCGKSAVYREGKMQHVSIEQAIQHASASLHPNQVSALKKKYGVRE
jgi:hypothetical protein